MGTKQDNMILAKMQSVTNLPTLPVVAHKISSAASNSKTDARKLANMMKDDPSIAARVLKVANSAFYARQVQITSVQHAIAHLGVNTIRDIALSMSVISAFGMGKKSRFNRQLFWKHAMCVGIGAAILAERVATKYPLDISMESLHLAGVLHDIGKIVTDQYFPDEFEQALQVSHDQQLPLIDAETQVMGTNHTHIGVWLCVQWNFPDVFSHVIRWHHDPLSAPKEMFPVVACVHIANYVCIKHQIGNSGNYGVAPFLEKVWKRMELTADQSDEIAAEINAAAESSELLSLLS